MNIFQFHSTSIQEIKKWPECLLLPLHTSDKLGPLGQILDQHIGGKIQDILDQKLYTPAPQTLFHIPLSSEKIKLIILIGIDAKEKSSDDLFCRFIKQAMNAVQSISVSSVGLCIEDYVLPLRDGYWKIKKAAECAQNAAYRFDQFKKSSSPVFTFQHVHLLVQRVHKTDAKALKTAAALAEGMTLMKDLGHMPPNICNPDYLAQEAKNLAKKYPTLSCKVLDEKEIKKLKMGGILAVSQGSQEKPRFIILEYKKGKSSQKPIVLVGKGVCFDTGGLSLKAPTAMVSMKFDMCGAASLLGTANTIASLELPLHVIFLIPAVTNMPDQNAYRPDDVVTTMSGLTVEITNTDAEGRMILCDALTYSKRYKPRYVVDVATLTGAIISAMGHHRSGLFSNDDTLAKALFTAAENAVDPTWRFPLDPIYYEPLKSVIADMVNAGEAMGARSITSACFLSRFTEELKWAHLDIAGIAIPEKKMDYLSGRPVPLLVEFLVQESTS